MDLALLIARLILGLGIAAHGAQKLFGWFGGYGLRNTGEFFVRQLHFPTRVFALLAGLGEFGGGLLIALGLFGPVGPALVIVVMIVAMLTVHVGNGFFADNKGIELPLVYATGALVLAFAGPGDLSLDAPLGLLWLSTPRDAWIAVALAILAALASVGVRRLTHAPHARAT
jgi:putative oxidoreductase